MEYEIIYSAQNIYQEPVTEAIFEFRVFPCNDDTQVVMNNTVGNSLNEPDFQFRNVFGFEVCRIRTTKPFKEFDFVMKATLQKKKPTINLSKELSLKEEQSLIGSTEFLIDHHLYLTKTSFTKLPASASSKIYALKKGQRVMEYLTGLNDYIHSLLTYKKNTTDVKTTAEDAFKLKSGVCQDYAHLFIAMARQQDIPSRYVSGYLNQSKRFIGASQMHAWVEALVPGIGWIGFDPTNKKIADENYIKVSHGTDYSDCSPIKGVLKTIGDNKTLYQVKVTAQ